MTSSKASFPYLCDFMTAYHDKPKGHYDPKMQQIWKDSFFREVRSHHVRKWIVLRSYGVEDPGPNDKPTKRRAESCNFIKKALSFYNHKHTDLGPPDQHKQPNNWKGSFKSNCTHPKT